MRIARPLVVFALSVGSGCGQEPEVAVVVHVPGGPARAERVELSLLASCGAIVEPGAAAPAAERSVVVSGEDGGDSIGFVPNGTHALYGRAWEDGCHLYAAGCAEFRIDGGARRAIELTLVPTECAPGASCAAPGCSEDDAGPPDAGPDLPTCGETKAFPTAEGFGAASVGGRGQRVVEVTNLDDSGAGSLRDALQQAGPRTIVFRVGGTIQLESPISLQQAQSTCTVAGQTAPGPGIELRGYGIMLRTGAHDVVLRHLRVRPGLEDPDLVHYGSALTLLGDWDGHDFVLTHHVIADHCSFSWGRHGDVLVAGRIGDVTVQWSIVSEAITTEQMANVYGAGLDVEAEVAGISLHHLLLAHNPTQNPWIQRAGVADLRNDVIYDWSCSQGAFFGSEPEAGYVRSTTANLVGNHFLDGPATDPGCGDYLWLLGEQTAIFADDNRGRNCPAGCEDEWTLGFIDQQAGAPAAPEAFQAGASFDAAPVSTDPADLALERVLSTAGATVPARDAVDARVVQEVVERTGGTGLGGADPPLEPSTAAPPDGDHDGMPDEWETARGLDPDDDADGPLDLDGNGYTELEDYLNPLAGDPPCR